MSSSLHAIAVAGASGRMGQMLIEAVQAAEDCRLAGALDLSTSPCIGKDASAYLGQLSGVAISADLGAGLAPGLRLVGWWRTRAVARSSKTAGGTAWSLNRPTGCQHLRRSASADGGPA